MANKKGEKRADNTDWKANRPKSGSSTKDWKNWAKTNPNRKVQAKKAVVETKQTPTTMTKANTPDRKAMVKKWQAARPVSGKGKSKSDEEKAQRRNQMKNWAKWNPNRGSNARRTLKGDK